HYVVGGDREHDRAGIALSERHRGESERARSSARDRLDDDVVRRQLGEHLARVVHRTPLGDDMNFVDQGPDALVGLPKQGSAAFLQCKQVLGLSPTRSRPETCAGSTGEDRCVHRHCWSWSDLTQGASMSVLRSEEHTSELQSRFDLVCRLLLLPPPSSTLFPYTTLFRSPDALVGLPKQGSAAFLQCKQVLGLSPTRSRPETCAGSTGEDRCVHRHCWSWSDLTQGASMSVLRSEERRVGKECRARRWRGDV